MKKIIGILNFAAGWITSILIICTILTSYEFINIGSIFDSYLPIQIGLAINMGLLALNYFIKENGRRKLSYSILSFAICIGLLFSISVVKR